jgi:hypothetical protein
MSNNKTVHRGVAMDSQLIKSFLPKAAPTPTPVSDVQGSYQPKATPSENKNVAPQSKN